MSDLPGPLANTARFTATTVAGSASLTETASVYLLVRAQGQTMYTGDGIGLGNPYGQGFDLVVFEGAAPDGLLLSGVTGVYPYTGAGSYTDLVDDLLTSGCLGNSPCNAISQIVFDTSGGYTTDIVNGGQVAPDIFLPMISN